ncbi:GAF domain-containing protein [Natronosalvus rutilus]|uniref:histidine kinase n=1 Tax=Natronosalvus rutilus TaxID=2953753 RepID=A0A9E7NF86_9EURY|nr:GAF domain-containing protein [Natronosalvus rutilus]UTF55909.1 PAS domain S-box protein [Natronosalvus rutilus]
MLYHSVNPNAMRMLLRTKSWRQWSVAGLGALLCGVVIGVVIISHPEWNTLHLLQIGIPILLALGLATYGGWLARSDLAPTRIFRIAFWSLAGAIILGTFAAWEMSTHILEGEPFVETLHELLLGVSEGATVGGVVGYYDARRRDQYLEAEQARQAISTSMDGIAILDEDGTYEAVNQAYVDIYDYDDSDAFIGETWQFCYTEEEATRIEEELMPPLYEEGEWRGELTGQRRDGSHFPQEITLSVRPNGGLACIVRDITERKRHEGRLEALHSVTRGFLAAETSEEIVTELVSVAGGMLGYPLTAVWEYDADADRLVPLTATESAQQFAAQAGLETLPVLESGAAEMGIFQGNEAVLVEDYQTLEDRQVSEIPLGAVLFIPLGEHGLVSIGSPEPGAIDATDRFLGEVLVSNARAAIDRLEREQELATREHRLRTIVENVPVILFAVNPDREITLQVGQGLEEVGIEQNQMVGATVDEMFKGAPTVIDAVGQALDGESVTVTTDLWGRAYQVWYQPIETDDEVTGVIGVAMDVTERHRRERGIRALHDATREMMQEIDQETICRIAVETAQQSLNLPMSAIWLRAGDQQRLEPIVWSDRAEELFGELPVFEPGNSISWQVFQNNELRIFEDVSTIDDRLTPKTEMRSELIVPIGEYGVLNSGSTTAGQFDETDVALAQLLAANTRAALERAEREEALQRQTDQMEFFHSILRHDVLNGITVIRSRAEFLADELDGEQLRDSETIVTWSNNIVEIVQRVRTVLETLTGESDTQLEPMDLAPSLRNEIERARATYHTVTFETAIPNTVPVLANELLGDVLGNIISNAVDHNDTDGLQVSITVEADDETVTVRIHDNGQGVSDDRKEVVFRRGETGHAKSTGSGFGLFFVDSMMAEYGGDVWVTDNDAGGATFVLQFHAPTV